MKFKNIYTVYYIKSAKFKYSKLTFKKCNIEK